jgi:hypothetical protein
MRWLRPAVLIAATIAVCRAQSSGTITGQVTDATEAAIPDVKISITAVGTGTRMETVTNSAGYYSVPSLPPGSYVVRAAIEGFKKGESKPVEVASGGSPRVDLVLTPLDSKQVVEVNADPPAIETQSSMLYNTVTQKEIESLPLAGRNVLDLALTMPGVTGDVGSDEGGIFMDVPTAGAGLSIGGGRTGSSAILSDGASATSLGIGRATVTFSPETIQEVQVITSTFSAKYGSTGGGIVQTVTRAGTDAYHGSLYWFHRNPFLAARQFNRPIEPQSRRNELGATFNGPVRIPKIYNGKGRTWFFAAVEPKVYFDQIDIYERVPTPEEREGDFRNTWVPPGQRRPLLYQQVRCTPTPQDCRQFVPFHRPSSTAQYPLFSLNDPDPTKRGYVIPKAMMDPLALKILEEIPLPNQPFDSQGRNYFGTRGVDGKSNRVLLKLDHNVSSRNRLSLNYRDIPTFADRFRVRKDQLFFSFPSDRSVTRQGLLSDSWTISPSAVNELRASYTYSDYSRQAPGDLASTNYTRDKFGLPSQTGWGYPYIATGWVAYGLNGALGDYIEHQYQLSNDLAINRGRHTFSIGGDFRHGQLNVKSTGLRDLCCGQYSFNASQTNSGNANTPGGTGGLAFAGFLLGVPNGVTLRGVVVPYYYRYNVAAAYFQDDFKWRRNLTLNIGVRWQYFSPRWEKFNRQASIDLNTPVEYYGPNGDLRTTFNYLFAGYEGRSRYLEPSHKKNFEPRIGFAWQPQWRRLRSRHAVLRGGYGVSHPPTTARGRDPVPDFGVAGSGAWGFLRWQSNTALPARTQGVNPQYVISLGRNQPVVQVNPLSLEIPAGGKLCNNCTRPLDPRLPVGAGVIFKQETSSPYIQTWNLTVQMELADNWVATGSYMGQKGTHLLAPLFGLNLPDREQYEELLNLGLDPNELIEDPFERTDAAGNLLQVRRVDLIRPFPDIGDVNVVNQTNASSIYHAGSLSVDRRYRAGYLRANYTWAKSIDTSSDSTLNGPSLYLWGVTRVQDPTNLGANRSVSNFDTRHRVNFSGLWELPLGRNKRFFSGGGKLRRVLADDWSISSVVTVSSGFPFQVFLGDANGVPGGATGFERIRPDIVPGVPLVNPRWSRNAANDVPYFNPEAFARPRFGNLGNAPRTLDYLRIPWRRTVNLTLLKEFRPFENRRRYLQLRGEAYNVTNTPVFTTDQGQSYHLFASGVPSSRTGLDISGPMPYLLNRGSADFAIGTRENILAQFYNQNFGKFWRDRNGPGRIIQLALRFVF